MLFALGDHRYRQCREGTTLRLAVGVAAVTCQATWTLLVIQMMVSSSFLVRLDDIFHTHLGRQLALTSALVPHNSEGPTPPNV